MAETTSANPTSGRRASGHASLADLAKTLEALEQRLERVTSSRKTRAPAESPAPSHAIPVSSLPPMPPRPLHAVSERQSPPKRRTPSLADAVSQIALRQKVLDDHPAPLPRPAQPPRGGRRDETQGRPRDSRPAARAMPVASAAPAALPETDGGLESLREELQRLRAELSADLQSSMRDEVAEMRQAFADLRETIAERQSVERIGAEIGKVQEGLDRMAGNGADQALIAGMRDELEHMSALVSRTAREESIEAVARRWDDFEAAQTGRDAEATQTKHELRAELERLRSSLSRLASEDQVAAVEKRWSDFEDRFAAEVGTEKLDAFAEKMAGEMAALREQLTTLASEQSLRAFEARWSDVETRWSDMEGRFASRGEMEETVAAMTARLAQLEESLAALPDALPFGSLDARIGALAETIQRISSDGDRAAENETLRFGQIEERLDEITRAILAVSEHRPEFDLAPMERLEARLHTLAERVDEIANDGTAQLLAERLAQMTDKIESLGSDPLSEVLAGQVERLAARLDEIEDPRMVAQEETAAIEARLRALAERIEAQLSTPRDDGAAIRGLEEQVSRIHAVLTSDGFGASPAIERRLDELERRVDMNAEQLIVAARTAADEAVRQVIEQGDLRQGEHIARLTEELEKLQKLSSDANVRSLDFFGAVNGALNTVVERIDLIERETQALASHQEQQEQQNGGEEWGEANARHAADLQAAHAAAAAAAAYESAEAESGGHEEADGAPRGLRAILNRNFKRGGAKETRVEPTGEDARWEDETSTAGGATPKPVAGEDVPSLDAADIFDSPEANRPLAIGSGTPDIAALLERVRHQKKEGKGAEEENGQADFIAAARRAAMAAAKEAEGFTTENRDEAKGGIAAVFAKRRKPIMLAAGAVLLAMMALPAGKMIIERTSLLAETPFENEGAGAEEPSLAAEIPGLVEQPGAGSALAGASEAETPTLGVSDEPRRQIARTLSETPREAPPSAPDIERQTAEASSPVTPAAFQPAGEPAGAMDTGALEEVVAALPEGIGSDALLQAARGGDPKALFEIGLRMMEGRTVSSDPQAAATWFERSADRGFAPAQYSLGTLFEKGNGVARDTIAARDWYLKAAEQGNVRAMHNLAVLYATGVDGKSEPALAARWFEQAADHGMTDSQYNLGILYARGAGVDQDLVQSYKWFSIVADAGDKDAAAKRDEVAKSLTPEQLDSARQIAAAFEQKERSPEANTVDIPDAWTVAAVEKPTTTASVDMGRAIRNIQAILIKLGYEPGTPDGKIGAKTTAAIKAFQSDIGIPATGEIDEQLIRALLDRKDGVPSA